MQFKISSEAFQVISFKILCRAIFGSQVLTIFELWLTPWSTNIAKKASNENKVTHRSLDVKYYALVFHYHSDISWIFLKLKTNNFPQGRQIFS